MGALSDHFLAGVATIEASASVVLMGRRRAARLVQARSTERPATAEEVRASGVDMWRCCRAVSRAAILLPWRVPCLPAAFALYRLLKWRGLASSVQLGATKIDGVVAAHAWVVCGGVKLDPLAPEDSYEPLSASHAEVPVNEGPAR